jgi:lysophospholipase L1-like esterase
MPRRVLVFGHSFVRKLEEFVIENQYRGWFNLPFDFRDIEAQLFGISGSTVLTGPKSMQNTTNMNIISSYNPDTIYLQVGGNDIKNCNVDLNVSNDQGNPTTSEEQTIRSTIPSADDYKLIRTFQDNILH